VDHNSTHFLAQDRAAELLGEANRERLAREARTARPSEASDVHRPVAPRWSFLSLRRSPAGSR
jgi:hypothetical protein